MKADTLASQITLTQTDNATHRAAVMHCLPPGLGATSQGEWEVDQEEKYPEHHEPWSTVSTW
ncbi:hypothetical protein FS749_003180 [Ceratobasidium sp. UAMH 11750]|nr:hypothetical protein FS749_003180 [Ceratobasidium sp. UAMH 11750]